VLIGFFGVLIIVQPGSLGTGIGTVAAIGSALMAAVVTIWLRLLSTTENVLTTSIIYNGFGTVVFALWVLATDWVPVMNRQDWITLISIGLIAGFQQYMFASAFRYGEAGLLAPFKYLILVFSAVVGYVFWNEVPPPATWLGGGVIVASGLFIIFRERRQGKAVKMPGFRT